MTNGTTIWKFPLQLTDRQTVRMPTGSDILHVDNQYNTICLWAQVDETNHNQVDRVIEIFGTGHVLPNARRSFLGTILVSPFVWHVFERLEATS